MGTPLTLAEVRVNLAAVQPRMTLEDYSSLDRFRNRMTALMKAAMAEAEPDCPTLVAFPEAIAMYLAFVPAHWDMLRSIDTFAEAVACLAPDGEAARRLFVDRAIETDRAYAETFSSLAKAHRAYIVAGSAYLPDVEESPHRGGRFVVDGVVRNSSYLFTPTGARLRRTPKVNIPPGEDLFTVGGSTAEVLPVDTAVGRIATLICWDGFHHSLVERCDALGAEIVVQPQYYAGAGPITQLDPWSFVTMIQAREHIRFGVSSFLVGSVFSDMTAEGRSYVAMSTGDRGSRWEDAIVAMADTVNGEEVVTAAVDLPRYRS